MGHVTSRVQLAIIDKNASGSNMCDQGQILHLQHPQGRGPKITLKHFNIMQLLVDLKKTAEKMALLL